MAESEEELKSLLMKVKEESEQVGLDSQGTQPYIHMCVLSHSVVSNSL